MAFVKIALQSNRMLPVHFFFFFLMQNHRPKITVISAHTLTHIHTAHAYHHVPRVRTWLELERKKNDTHQFRFESSDTNIYYFYFRSAYIQYFQFQCKQFAWVRPTAMTAAAATMAASVPLSVNKRISVAMMPSSFMPNSRTRIFSIIQFYRNEFRYSFFHTKSILIEYRYRVTSNVSFSANLSFVIE